MRIPTPNESAQPADQQNKGCIACFAAICLVSFVLSGMMCGFFNSSSPPASNPSSIAAPASDELALAQVDFGPDFAPDSATLQQYTLMLDRLDKAFPEDRHQIAQSLLKTYPAIKQNDPTLNSILVYGNLMANIPTEEMQKANQIEKKRRHK